MTAPAIMAAAATITAATRSSRSGHKLRKSRQTRLKKTRTLKTTKRQNTTARHRRAGITTAAAGLPNGSSRNGQTTRTANKAAAGRAIAGPVGFCQKSSFFLKISWSFSCYTALLGYCNRPKKWSGLSACGTQACRDIK